MKNSIKSNPCWLVTSAFLAVMFFLNPCIFANDFRVTRICFGSCIKQDKPIPILKSVNRQKPDAFVFLGDNIYADTEDMKVMQKKYDLLAADSEFQKLRANAKIFATWDDHDYGKNDAGADYQMKKQSRDIFLDFWKVPKSSPRRKHEGIYDSVINGIEGRRWQLILLDTRYFRGPLKKGDKRTGGPYYPTDDKSISMLGETQWKWLEEQLKKPAEIRIIASSIQLIAESAGQETWSNIPHERKRFFDLIRKTKAKGVVLISGDRHWSELSAYEKDLPYRLYDLTSSSLNQPHGRGTPTKNKWRAFGSTYHKENFGVIDIAWYENPPKVSMSIEAADGAIVLFKELKFSDLKTSR